MTGRWDLISHGTFNTFQLFFINLDKRIFNWLAKHGLKREGYRN